MKEIIEFRAEEEVKKPGHNSNNINGNSNNKNLSPESRGDKKKVEKK